MIMCDTLIEAYDRCRVDCIYTSLKQITPKVLIYNFHFQKD